MSDRPMRLKYLKTKMKILCFFLLWILAVSVFGEPQELNGILGESVKFPAAVKIEGSWMYSGVLIGDVTSGRFKAASNVEYSDRVHWDSSTGLFSLSGLRLKDSGIYTVQDTQQTSVSTFNLTVWEDNVPVSKPHVSITRNEYPCTLQCTAERGTGATLSWYREGEKKPYVSSPVASAPHLHLPVPVESGTYTCEAKNSVSNEKVSITMGADCAAGLSAGTIAAIITAAVAIIALIAVLCVLYRHIRSKHRDDIRSKHRDAVGTVILDIRSMHPDIRSQNPAVRKLILDVNTLLDTLGQLAPAVGTVILDIRSMHPDIGRGNPAVRKLILDVKTLLDTLVQFAPGDEGWTLFPAEQLQAIPPDDTGSKSKGFDMSDRKNEQGREEGDPLQNDM